MFRWADKSLMYNKSLVYKKHMINNSYYDQKVMLNVY